MPDISLEQLAELENDELKFGIADGGHTFEVIQQTMSRWNELNELEGWKSRLFEFIFWQGTRQRLNWIR